MLFTLPELPFAKDSLAPFMSAETLDFHYGKHHSGYVSTLNKLIQGTKFAELSLEAIIKESTGALLFRRLNGPMATESIEKMYERKEGCEYFYEPQQSVL